MKRGTRRECTVHANSPLKDIACVLLAQTKDAKIVCRRKDGKPSASRDSVATAAEARRRLKSRGSQLDMADELERDRPFSRVSAENESELLDCDDAIFLTSSDSAVSALLGYAQEEQEMFEGEEVETEPSQSSCTAYVFGGYGS